MNARSFRHLLWAIPIALSGCATSHQVYRVKEATNTEGILYSLPRTVSVLKVPVANVTLERGKYVDYLGCLYKNVPSIKEAVDAGVYHVILKDGKTFEIDFAKIELGFRSEPDPAQVFRVDLDGNTQAERRSLLMTLGEMQTITGARSDVEDVRADYALKTIEIVGNLTATIATGGGLETLSETAIETEDHCKNPPEDASVAIDKLALLSKARIDTVNEIKGVEGARSSTLEAMWQSRLAAISEAERKLLKLFMGSSTVNSWTAVYEVRFDKPGQPVKLFRFSPDGGFHSYVSTVNAQPDWVKGNEGQDFQITCDLYPAEEQQLVRFADFKPVTDEFTEPRGFYYRVPVSTNIALSALKDDSATNVFVASQRVAQLGKVRSLPSKISGSKKTVYDVGFHADLGSLSKVQVDTAPIDPNAADKAVAAVQNVLKETSPMSELQRQATAAEARQKIFAAEKAIDDARKAEAQAMVDRLLQLGTAGTE